MTKWMLLNSFQLTRSMVTLGVITTLGIGSLSACMPEAAVSPTDETEVTASNPDDTDLASQVGKSFYLYSQFKNQFSDALFVVQEDEGFDWGEVLVINRSDRAFQVPTEAETPLWIFGKVETLTQEDLQSNNVPEADWENYLGEPVLVAERITLAPSPSDLVNNADAFLNQEITVYGTVEAVEADNTFVLQDPELFEGKGIILIQGADADLSALIGEERAVVSGILRPYVVADLQNQYELTWDVSVQEQLEADYKESPVIIVEQALPVDD